MRLSNIQAAGLSAEASCATSEVAKDLVGTERLAYTRGIQDGRTLLARELLQEVKDRGGDPLTIAALDLYRAGRWLVLDSAGHLVGGREAQTKLWVALRDALGLPPGTSTAQCQQLLDAEVGCDLTGAARR